MNKELTFNDLPMVVAQLRDEVVGMKQMITNLQSQNKPQKANTQTKGKPKGRFFWYAFGIYKPKVTMFAEEMWFGGGEGVECGRSTGLCPLPLGVPRCVIHNKKNVGTKFW